MTPFYVWALSKYHEEDGRSNDHYPCICQGNKVCAWDDINEAIAYRVEHWDRFWGKGALMLICYYDDGTYQVFDDMEVYSSYDFYKRSKS